MTSELYWRALRWPALEHLHLEQDARGISADGLIVGAFGERPLRLRYQIHCDPGWQTTSLQISSVAAGGETIQIHRGPDGSWTDTNGMPRPDLAGAVDIDISATPFTNTLPARRLQLAAGQSREIDTVYVAVTPKLEVCRARQRYTRLDEANQHYLYESLESDFRAELRFDLDLLVLEYPGIWERIDAVIPGS